MANKPIPGIGTANDYRLNSGRFAYGKEAGLEAPKRMEKFLPKDTVTKTPRSADWRAAQKKTFAASNAKRTAEIVRSAAKPSVAGRVVDTAARVALRAAGPVGALVGMGARGALRAAGPVGALVGMTEPAGAPEGHPAYESSTVKRTGSYGPVMKGNADQMRGSRVGPTQAPNRTAPSTSSPSKGKSSYGGGARDSGGASKSTPARGTERFAKGSLVKSKVNQAGAYTKPGMRKKLFESIKASAVQGTKAGQWSARKAQLLAKRYKASGGGYK